MQVKSENKIPSVLKMQCWLGFFPLTDAILKYSQNCNDLDKARQDGRIKDLHVYFNKSPKGAEEIAMQHL